MNSEIFAEWLRRQGHFVVKTASSYWYDASPRIYQAFPYHWVIHPTDEELLSLLRPKRGIALRYSTTVDNSIGYISYHIINEEPSYSLDNLKSKNRRHVRIGLKNCRVEQISLEHLAEEGWLLEKNTVQRQQRRIAINKEIWRQRYMAAADLPGFETWGAFVDGRLVASLLTFQYGDCCEGISQQSHRDFLSLRINNALLYVFTQKLIDRSEIRSIFYGLHSLDAPASVDQFKFRMGYSPKPVRQRVVFHPCLKAFANTITHKISVSLLRFGWHYPLITKAEGMLRFYLQGRRPIQQQDWPECIVDKKSDLLKALNLQVA